MGRPTASPMNKSIAQVFARALTTRTANPDDKIARCGQCSLFSLLRQALPQIVRDENFGNRGGISEVEFNKVLQVLKIIEVLIHIQNGFHVQ